MKYILIFALLIASAAIYPVSAQESAATATAGNATASATAGAATAQSESTAGRTDADTAGTNAIAQASTDNETSSASSQSVTKHKPVRHLVAKRPPAKSVKTASKTVNELETINLEGPPAEKIATTLPVDQPDQNQNDDTKKVIDRLRKSNRILALASLILILIVIGLIIGFFLSLRR